MNKYQKHFQKGMSFKDYLSRFQNLVSEGKSSGENQSDFYINYTKINLSRTSRIEKTIRIQDSIKSDLNELKNKVFGMVFQFF